jgi:hypothetical protein
MSIQLSDLSPRLQVIAAEQMADTKGMHHLTAAERYQVTASDRYQGTFDPSPRKPQGRPEEEIQAAAIRLLELSGYLVMQTTNRPKSVRCSCGEMVPPNRHYGATMGVPDLLVTRETWPAGVFLGIELKLSTGSVQPEQALLAALRRIEIARSPEQTLHLAQQATANFLLAGYGAPKIDAEAVAKAKSRILGVQGKRKAARKR